MSATVTWSDLLADDRSFVAASEPHDSGDPRGLRGDRPISMRSGVRETYSIGLASPVWAGFKVGVCVVVGFPQGSNTVRIRTIDVVMRLRMLTSGEC